MPNPNTFGVEIEFLAPGNMTNDSVAGALTRATGIQVSTATRNSGTRPTWKIVNDGSVTQSGRTGMELVSPVLTIGSTASVEMIDKLCRALSQLGVVVNRSCGLHVHIGARSFPLDAIKRLTILYAESEPFLDQLLPPSRRGSNNGYCKSVKANLQLQRVLSASDVGGISQGIAAGDRHVKLNLTAFWKHGTVEFRHHSGTIDPEKIKHWAFLCGHLVDAALREVALPVATATPPSGTSSPGRYWTTGRRRRIYYRMLTRAEGVTVAQMQEALGVGTPPGIVYHLRRAGADAAGWTATRNSNGDIVYRIPTSGTVLPEVPTGSHWQSSVRARTIYQMLTRPNGATAEEVRAALGSTTRPDIVWHCGRAGTPATLDSARRDGFVIYRLPAAGLAPAVPVMQEAARPISSLDVLLERLQVPPSERTYWTERAALLSEATA